MKQVLDTLEAQFCHVPVSLPLSRARFSLKTSCVLKQHPFWIPSSPFPPPHQTVPLTPCNTFLTQPALCLCKSWQQPWPSRGATPRVTPSFSGHHSEEQTNHACGRAYYLNKQDGKESSAEKQHCVIRISVHFNACTISSINILGSLLRALRGDKFQ